MLEGIISTLFASMRQALNNQFVGGGLVLMLLGALGALGRRIPAKVWTLLKRQFIVSFEVMSSDPTFHWLNIWLDEQPFSKRVRDVTVSVRKNLWGDTINEAGPEGGPKVIMTPAPGTHWFWYRNRFVLLTRERKEASGERLNAYTPPAEKFYLRILGRKQTVLTELIADARRMSLAATGARVSVHISAAHSGWRKISHYAPRPLASVILPDGMKEGIVSDIEKFFAAREWYEARGVPWRRGYLFHGAPGSGKTSLIGALAGELRFDLYVLNLTSNGMNDEQLLSLMLDLPPRSAVILEEITDVINGREVKNVGEGINSSAVTYGGFINALDGVVSKEGVLVFMTTNQVVQLDASLLRHGRIDVPVRFSHATRSQVERMFKHFYPGAPDLTAMAGWFADAVAARGVTMAAVQHHLLKHAEQPLHALNHAHECGGHILEGMAEAETRG